MACRCDLQRMVSAHPGGVPGNYQGTPGANAPRASVPARTLVGTCVGRGAMPGNEVRCATRTTSSKYALGPGQARLFSAANSGLVADCFGIPSSELAPGGGVFPVRELPRGLLRYERGESAVYSASH